MRILKHILVMVALIAAMLPCTHAVDHDHHDHDDVVVALHIHAGTGDHDCCDEGDEVPQNRSVFSDLVAPPITSIGFIFPSETKVIIYKSPQVLGILAYLQTVQFLI